LSKLNLVSGTGPNVAPGTGPSTGPSSVAPGVSPRQDKQQVLSYHDHNEAERIPYILEQHGLGKTIALVSDAGMPLIQDPGYKLVQALVEQEVDFEVLPGPTALMNALLLSGLPPYPFSFYGFMPIKSGKKKQVISEISGTTIFYESPYRIIKTLETVKEILGPNTQVSVSRELTKKFEETVRGTVTEVLEQVKPKGEFVLVVYK
jgi:16S rRNA (cytidine1402-2'-O)-methyltransferase